jgi:hypothetical protein
MTSMVFDNDHDVCDIQHDLEDCYVCSVHAGPMTVYMTITVRFVIMPLTVLMTVMFIIFTQLLIFMLALGLVYCKRT